jgi:hypothetical protein
MRVQLNAARVLRLDLVAVLVKYLEDGTERQVVICSAYLPYDSDDTPPSKALEELVRYCEEQLPLSRGISGSQMGSGWRRDRGLWAI